MTKRGNRAPAQARRAAKAPRTPQTKEHVPAAFAELQGGLKAGPEQQNVVGPLIVHLRSLGWALDQLRFGTMEWYVPKSPSEAFKREKGQRFDGFPCDITVFDSASGAGDYRHVRIIFECKTPDEKAGVGQLETLLALEPYAQLGIWANNPSPAAKCVFVYKTPGGTIQRTVVVADIPRPGDSLAPTFRPVTFKDLAEPTPDVAKRAFSHLLDDIVTNDSNVTRREEQLDQLCNIILLKLQSDQRAKLSPAKVVTFAPKGTARETADAIRVEFGKLVKLYPDVFTTAKDQELRFTDETIYRCLEDLHRFTLAEMGAEAVSTAFQVLRTAALKEGEGQYFTPYPVIQAAVKLMEIDFDDIVIDPACGTGGFLIDTLRSMQARYPDRLAEVAKWAQTHIFGIDKDSVGVKLTKAIMQILGDGSVNCVRGDSLRTYLWPTDFPHLMTGNFQNERFTVVLTNPPFGKNLRVPAADTRRAGLDIAKARNSEWEDLETGLVFLNRCWQLLRKGGRICIVLPETYFMSPKYEFVQRWARGRLRPFAVVNVPMEAFQEFCRAKTNLYLFEKT